MQQLSPERQRKTILKVSWRLLPLIVLCYLINYIDRTNVSFAALTMNKDLGLTAYMFGLGAGIFFLSYALFEVPSNIVLQKVGARLWIARIMITWGIVSGLMATATGPYSFLALRFLLGVAEAGFFPGMIFYLTQWFPKVVRARAIAILYVAVPASNAIASVISGAILANMDGTLGLKGWQWVFIIEAIPAVLLAFVVLRTLTDTPAKADWLEADERTWLQGQLDSEREHVERIGRLTMLQALIDPRVLILSLIYFTAVTASYGLVFFMPQIVKGLGLGTMETGLVTAIPYIVGTIGLIAFGYSSDKFNERRWHLIVSTGLSAVGYAIAALNSHSYFAIAAMAIAAFGIYGSRPSFWPMPSMFLTGASAAVGMAFINSIGNLGGYIGPQIVGYIKDTTKSFEWALWFMCACAAVSTVIAYLATRSTNEQPVPAESKVPQTT
jgi:ACS family tartrate transporter-like MFS transporter